VSKLGVGFDWRAADLKAMAKIAQAAEELGFEVVWVPEAWGLEAFSTISHILSMTSRIKVGAGIINVFSRSAALIGMGCATLGQLAPDRFLLGLGVSGRRLVEGWHGVKFEEPFGRLKEYLDVIRLVSSGAPVDYSGKTLRLGGFRLYTRPTTPPSVLLGALGERSLRLAARLFDGAILTMYPSSRLRWAAEIVGSHSSEKQIHYLQPVALKTSSGPSGDFGYVAKTIAFYVSSMGDYYYRNLANLGFSQEVERIATHYRAGNREEAAQAAGALVEELALVGTPREVAQKLSSYPPHVTPVMTFRASSGEDVEYSISTMREITRELDS